MGFFEVVCSWRQRETAQPRFEWGGGLWGNLATCWRYSSPLIRGERGISPFPFVGRSCLHGPIMRSCAGPDVATSVWLHGPGVPVAEVKDALALHGLTYVSAALVVPSVGSTRLYGVFRGHG